MTKVIGVRFRNVGKLYYFDPADFEIKNGDRVIVETARGVECGHVNLGVHEVDDLKIVKPLKSVIRLATKDDIAQYNTNRFKEKEAQKICQKKIREHELDMKLVDVEYTFDGQKILFYFTADGRVDFRELVKDLAGVFRTRIELRQIGVRDESKLLGGIGICGKQFCCSSFLFDFQPVSIKMAKEQGKSL
ncbi:MAG: regulatory iron-sulfur-containing complex subunit RicT, partial [Oscillospiraceae bacterium]